MSDGNNKCVCMAGFFMKDGKCAECKYAIPGCLECSDENKCTKCIDQEHFDPNPNGQGTCSCVEGWTLDDKICKAC